MGTKLAKWVLSVSLALILLLSVAPVLAISPTDSGSKPPASSEFGADETQTKEVYRVTLITGDVVTVAVGADGKRNFAISPAEPEKLGQQFLTIEQEGNTYIFPDGVDLKKLDMELFNIDYLVDEQYYQEPSLPLLVSYLPSLPEPAAQSLEGKVRALGQETKRHQEVATISTHLVYSDIATSYRSLVSQPEVEKIWLDRKVHAQLNESVPLIGAPSWWGAGYNGTGVKIAILDTGIDSSHPALDDLDDNPATNDPKVKVKVNFTDDQSFDDLFGHGTHVAGIAAGTGAGTAAQAHSVEKIVFTSNRTGNLDIWMINPDGTQLEPLTNNPASDDFPMLSPDGTKLAFISNRAGDGNSNIHILNLLTGIISDLTTNDSYTESDPTWSPDSSEIAFASRRGGYDAIWRIPAQGGQVTQVTFPTQTTPIEGHHSPDWSPDGSNIVFQSTQGHRDLWAIWEVSLSSGVEKEIIPFFGNEYEPKYSPDQAKILWTHYLNSSSSYANIWIAASNGDNKTQITFGDYTDVSADWSMVRNKVVFASNRAGTSDVWVVNSDTTGLTQLTMDDFNNTNPSWGIYTIDTTSPHKGVAPGAWLWNVKVLNQYGYGYWSWIINGVNFASLGADGVARTGDEADIISMSLGGSPTDGTDPASKAVNLAVDRGVVVAVAAGNSGYSGLFTIGSPGVAEKVITVGASDKQDILAGFSSRGPTIDLRIKPDILAPGVSITSSVPTNPASYFNDPSGYKSLSGTSMATPHVAGAAALLVGAIKAGGAPPAGLSQPQVVKDLLMSIAKDLGYSIYEQGSGRLDLSPPWSKVSVTPASLSLGKFTSANTTASANLTFSNTDNVSHQVSLSANLTDIFSGTNYSANVTLSSSNFTLPAHGQIDVSLSVNLTSLPASLYGGKVIATVDGGASRTIHAIFGLAKVREVTVHKTDINGAPAQKHPLWVVIESPVQTMFVQKAYTDASGNFTFGAIDGNYHLLSPNWGHAENQTTIWTIAENVTISSDMSITLDERDTRLVDFNPNKAGQVIPDKTSSLYYNFDGRRYGWASWWWYANSFLTRVSPINRFNASFSYNYYPEADFNSANPSLVNTGEWHNLLYSTTNITDNTTFAADYNNLVHRSTGYGVALNGEQAYWAQWSDDNIGSSWGSFRYEMDAPRQRWEWLSPFPVRYGQNYARANPWGEWYFYGYMNYSPGEYSWRIGGHPFISGVGTSIWWGATENYLYIAGTISRDSSGNELQNQRAKYSGKIKVTKGSAVVLETDIWDSFWQQVRFAGSANFTVEIDGRTPLALSSKSYTRLDFTTNQTGDSYPPQLLFQVPGINLFGVTPAGEVEIRVQATDYSQIGSVRLNYSLDDSANWTDAGVPTLAGGWYTFSLGVLQGTFVSIAVDATDQYGNRIHRNTQRAFYVGGPAGAGITGVTYEVNGAILAGATITLDGATSVVSDSQGNYQIIAATTGQHTLVATKTGFRSQPRTVTVTDLGAIYTLDFKANDGLVPNAPNLSYALNCINKWKFPPAGFGLSLSKVLSVINAWKFPIP